MWRRRASIGGPSTSRNSESSGQSNSITGYPSLTHNSFYTNNANDRPLVFSLEVPTVGPLGLDLRARHVERDKPQRGAVVKGFRGLEGGRKGYVEETGRVKVGDILQIIHQTHIDDMPFEQIVNHAKELQSDASAWPLRLEFRREPNGSDAFGAASASATPSKPRKSSFFSRPSMINPAQDGNFNEKLQYFRGFFANRMPTGGAAPNKKNKPPMPSPETVNEMYRDLLLKRGVPDDVMDELVRIESTENKWHVVWYAQQHDNNEDGSHSNLAEAARMAENLVELKWDNKGLKELETLQTKISSGSAEWIEAFLENFGLDYLTMKLPDPSPFPIEHSRFEKAIKICKVILRTLRSVTHFTAGVEAITNVPGLVKRVALCFHTDDADLKKETLQLLGIVCYNSAAGHQAVIEAFDHYKEAKGENIRFTCLKDALKSTRYSLSFKEDVLSFVNIIVNKAIRLEDRLAIRSDFIALKMAGYFEEVRAKSMAVQRQRENARAPATTTASPQEPMSSLGPAAMAAAAQLDVPTSRDTLTPDAVELPKRVRDASRSPELRPSKPSPLVHSKSAPPSPAEAEQLSLLQPDRTSLPRTESTGSTIMSNSVDQLRTQLDNMEKQIDVFERFMEDDRKDTIYEQTDLASPESVFQTLVDSVSHDRELELCLLSVLQQLLFIPADRVIGKEMWALCERLMKQVGLLSPVEEVRNFELSYDDRKVILKLRDRYTEFLQKYSEEDPSFSYHIGPILLIENRRPGSDDLLDADATDTDDEEKEELVMAKDHPDFAKYFKLLKMGMPMPHVVLKMRSELGTGADEELLNTPDKMILLKAKEDETDSVADDDAPAGIRAEEHEKYAKFFKLKKMGMPLPHIELKMSAEGLDAKILETPDLLLDEQGNEITSKPAGIPVKEHEKFAKFFKLLKMGMPVEHVKLKASAEGLNAALLDSPDTLLDVDGNEIKDEVAVESKGIPVKDHDKYAKFFKLMKMGMPLEHIKLKVSAEGLDATLLDTPDELLDEEGKRVGSGESSAPQGIPVREHEKYAKFFKLMKMGMPLEHIKLKVSAEGLNATLLDTPDKLLNAEGEEIVEEAEPVKGIPVREHEKYAKFFKLLKMGMPVDHVKLKASAEGLHGEWLDTPDKLIDEEGNEITSAEEPKGIPVKDHEKFAKFFKLMKMGMPLEHIKLKASQEGLDGNLLETPDKLVDEDGKEVTGAGSVKKVKASEHPSYAKYFKLMKMGMPRPQIELKMGAEGLDAKVLDTPDEMIPEAIEEPKAPPKPVVVAPPKPKLRNLYWESFKEKEKTTGTIWEKFAAEDDTDNSSDDATSADESLQKYVDKLADIFVNKPAKEKEPAAAGGAAKKAASKRRAPTRVALIDVKRANNIGIMLARFRMPYSKIRDAVLQVDKDVLSVEKLSALIQFAPEDAEIEAVKGYTGDPKLLGDAEQYFYELLSVPRLSARLQAIHATWQFDTYVEEQQRLMASVTDACRELQSSTHLREIFKVGLSLGNALNDGTARGAAKGFRLNILLKLGQVKASDNSITLLNYVAQVLRAKDPAILAFDKEMPSIESASRVTFQVLKAGEGAVRKAATLICTELETHAKLPPTKIAQPEKATDDDDVPEVKDRFQEAVQPFAERAKKVSEEIQVQLDEMAKTFENTVSFFGEDPSSPECGPDAFFSLFYSFAKLLQSADRDNERKRIAEERRIRREEETKKRLEQLKRSKTNRNFASLKDGDVDDIVMKIRAKRVAEKRKELLQTPFEEDRLRSASRSSMQARSSSNGGGPIEAA
ncbi:TPA: hypothetical protein N0F65_001083 [Lagenidium giganteum]|uniref:Uncharacterized protein n=1 Tax=Lagenidium giganteum TaxID=4803 RepID=A0AAV2YJC6_9STRA|nr:TPA: hypothetical protein N0F65_001083 [Lagenidium giganteum]